MNISSLNLNNLFVLITNVCNLQCKHCYVSSSPKGEFGLDFNTIIKVAKDFNEIFGRQIITLSGGEVFMRKDIDYLINSLTDYHNVFILTNGTLINDKTLKNFPQKNIAFRIGLDGVTSKSHDYIRGEGNHKKAIKGIENLFNYGYRSGQVEIFYTTVPENIQDIGLIPNFADKYNISRLILEPIAVHGRASQHWEKTKVLGNDEFRKAFEEKINQIFSYSNWNTKEVNHNFQSLTVYSNANVYPFTTTNEFDEKIGLLGNLYNNSLSEILQPEKYRNVILMKTMNYLKTKGNSIGSIRVYQKNISEYVEFN